VEAWGVKLPAITGGGKPMPKQVVYMLDGKPLKTVVDMDDQIAIPKVNGEVVLEGIRYKSLKGPEWKTGQRDELAVYTIYLGRI
jgi:hypothetical protein